MAEPIGVQLSEVGGATSALVLGQKTGNQEQKNGSQEV